MKKFPRSLMAATFALTSYVALPAHAEVLNIPASAALMEGDPLSSGCQVGPINGSRGISADSGIGICDFRIPLAVAAGHTIQQISVVHGSDSNGSPAAGAALSTVNFLNSTFLTEFSWVSFAHVPDGTFEVTRLMAQPVFPKNTYPDAFLVQPNTMYEVLIHLESGAFMAGLQVTYQ